MISHPNEVLAELKQQLFLWLDLYLDMAGDYKLRFKVCIGESLDLWSIQNLQGDWFSRKEYYSSENYLRLFSEVMR